MPERDALKAMSPAHYTIGPLEAATWKAFAELVERNNGIYGGCWCAPNHVEYQRGVSDPRTLKEELVRAGCAHAALVFDRDGNAQGWCQYGSPRSSTEARPRVRQSSATAGEMAHRLHLCRQAP